MEIGPQLPPHLACKTSDDHDTPKIDTDVCELPKTREHFGDNEVECGDKDGGDPELFGPALPPGFNKPKPRPCAIIGPGRPEAMGTGSKSSSGDDNEEDDDYGTVGPRLPTKNDEDEYLNRRREEIESRAKVKKDELVDQKDKRPKNIEREEWMTELPPELGKNFGLGARTFRNKDVNLGDRSVWTDTPSDRTKKRNKEESKKPEKREKSRKELDTEHYVSEHNKRFRTESLLDMHHEDQKKKKKSEGTSEKERRPFDRDVDLGARQMDAAKRKSLIKQSRHLNTKFEHSKQGPTYL